MKKAKRSRRRLVTMILLISLAATGVYSVLNTPLQSSAANDETFTHASSSPAGIAQPSRTTETKPSPGVTRITLTPPDGDTPASESPVGYDAGPSVSPLPEEDESPASESPREPQDNPAEETAQPGDEESPAAAPSQPPAATGENPPQSSPSRGPDESPSTIYEDGHVIGTISVPSVSMNDSLRICANKSSATDIMKSSSTLMCYGSFGIPGEAKLSVISGYNYLEFNKLRDAGIGDEVIIQFENMDYVYVIKDIIIASKLNSVSGGSLLLYTGYPFERGSGDHTQNIYFICKSAGI